MWQVDVPQLFSFQMAMQNAFINVLWMGYKAIAAHRKTEAGPQYHALRNQDSQQILYVQYHIVKHIVLNTTVNQ